MFFACWNTSIISLNIITVAFPVLSALSFDWLPPRYNSCLPKLAPALVAAPALEKDLAGMFFQMPSTQYTWLIGNAAQDLKYLCAKLVCKSQNHSF